MHFLRKHLPTFFLQRIMPCMLVGFFVWMLVLNTGIITEWGRWYSPHPYVQAQTQALMAGHLAISDNPADLRVDLLWHNGVQQVWGLGIPLVHVPLYAIANLFGYSAFPDRVTFTLFLFLTACVIFFTLRTLCRKCGLSSLGAWGIAFLGSVLFIWFPPFVAILKSRFLIYEETIAFLSIASTLTATLLVRYIAKGSTGILYAAAFLCGFLPNIRPTGIFYGAIIFFLLIFVLYKKVRQSPHAFRSFFTRASIAGLIFASGIVFLLATNAIRMGGVFEFGHHVNVSYDIFSLDLTRFDTDWDAVPITGKIGETARALFAKNTDMQNLPYINAGIRWKFLYFKAYDWSYAALLILALIIALFQWIFGRKGYSPTYSLFFQVISLYIFASFAALLCFYSLSPALASRYFIDFAPIFFWAIISILLFVAHISFSKKFSHIQATYSRIALISICIAWVVFEWYVGPHTQNINPYWAPLVTRKDFLFQTTTGIVVPDAYEKGKTIETHIPYNMMGWDQVTGEVNKVATFFVKKPQKITLTLHTDAELHEEDIQMHILGEKMVMRGMGAVDSYPHKYTFEFEVPENFSYSEKTNTVYIQFPQRLFVQKIPVFLDSLETF